MEKIVSNLHDFDPDCATLFIIAEQLEKKMGVCSEPISDLIAAEFLDYSDCLLTKASLAIKEAAKALIDGDTEKSEKYRGISEGLCYAVSEAIGLPFVAAWEMAFNMARKI